jgi:hypothetical protein
MPTYKLGELIEKMAPQARRDKALISRCVDGFALYTAQIAAKNKTANKIDEMRKFADRLVGYWGLDDGENVTPPRDLMEAFYGRVYDAKKDGAVIGDVYQSAPNIIFGLHRYGEDAMSEILDACDLMKEIAEAWEFEPDVLNDLTAHLESEVREILDGITLPGQPVNGLKNAGYVITRAVLFDNDRGFAMAHSSTAPSNYVTWQFTNDNGKHDHYWGRYIGSEERALIDYITRVADYKEQYKVTEIPLPITAAEVEAAAPSVPAPESGAIFPEIMAEQFSVIELFGRKALYSDGRIDRNKLPDGVHCYDTRHGDDGIPCTLEAFVGVNHNSTIISMTDFGLSEKDSYIPIDYDTELNFLSAEATIGEYMAGWTEPSEPLPGVISPSNVAAKTAATHDAGEKPSVMEKIRAAQIAPKVSAKPKPERDKKKQEPDL